MVSAEDCLWGPEFFNTYMKHAERMSYKNEILHKAASISLVGQALRDVYLEVDQQYVGCRVHPFIIQSSGTGKNSVFSMMGKVAEAAGMSFDEEGTASTAGIMGTIRRNGEEIKGDLAGSGFVAWKEAQTLLKSAEQTHSSDILEVMNMAMDPSGNVSKTLSGGDLEYRSNTSVFCTTYDPEPSGQLELIRQGFLPRTLFFYRTVTDQYYDEINEMRDEKLPRGNINHKSERKEFERDVEKLANTLRYIEDTVHRHGNKYFPKDKHFAVGDPHIDYISGLEDGLSVNPSPMMNEVLDDYPYSIRKQASPFKTRMFDKVYRIAACLAAADYDEKRDVHVCRKIKERHIKLAKNICEQSFRSVLDFIHDYSIVSGDNKLRQLERKVNTIAKNNGGHATIKELMSETYRKKKDIKNDLAALEEMGKINSVDKPITAADSNHRVKPE